MGDSEKFSNNTPDLQDAIRSIEATGEDSGAISGEREASNAESRGEPGALPRDASSDDASSDDASSAEAQDEADTDR
jgi:hypothetical protein